MRKDVKIGLGIGGVLLAVLIVYLLVPKNDGTGDLNNGGESARTSDQGTGGTSPAVANTGSGTGIGSEPTPVAGGGTGVASGTNTGSATEPTGDTGIQPEARAGPEVATADAIERDGPPPPKVDWDTVFATGHIPEDYRVGLVAQNPQPQNTQPDPFADNAGKSGSEPDWTGVRGGTTSTGTTGNSGASSPTPPVNQPPANSGSKGAAREHVIQQGENLSMIAAVAYGDARHYREILKANPNLDERKLRPGTVIKMPDASTFTSTAKAQQAVARQEGSLDPTKQYRVQQGDSLHKIAMKLYGKASKADALYEHNKDKIGDDSSRLKLGTVLKLPEAPTVAQTGR